MSAARAAAASVSTRQTSTSDWERGRHDLTRDLSQHDDVLFSLLMVCQPVIDIAGELSARRGDTFEDHTGAARNQRRGS